MARELDKAYSEYNKKYFRNRLPQVPVRWSNCLGRDWLGEFDEADDDDNPGKIRISRRIVTYEKLWRMTLLHEMAHVKVNHLLPHAVTQERLHSRVWQKEMKRLAALNAFADLW